MRRTHRSRGRTPRIRPSRQPLRPGRGPSDRLRQPSRGDGRSDPLGCRRRRPRWLRRCPVSRRRRGRHRRRREQHQGVRDRSRVRCGARPGRDGQPAGTARRRDDPRLRHRKHRLRRRPHGREQRDHQPGVRAGRRPERPVADVRMARHATGGDDRQLLDHATEDLAIDVRNDYSDDARRRVEAERRRRHGRDQQDRVDPVHAGSRRAPSYVDIEQRGPATNSLTMAGDITNPTGLTRLVALHGSILDEGSDDGDHQFASTPMRPTRSAPTCAASTSTLSARPSARTSAGRPWRRWSTRTSSANAESGDAFLSLRGVDRTDISTEIDHSDRPRQRRGHDVDLELRPTVHEPGGSSARTSRFRSSRRTTATGLPIRACLDSSHFRGANSATRSIYDPLRTGVTGRRNASALHDGRRDRHRRPSTTSSSS